MTKLPTIALLFSLFLISCGGGDDADITPPTIKVISPVENDTIFGGNNIELNIEIIDNRYIRPTKPHAVISFESALKNVNKSILDPWTISFTNDPINISEVTRTPEGYKYSVKVSIPTKNENEEYARPGKYELNVWEAIDNAGNSIKREDGPKVTFFIKFPPL
jgi:hypothetical protein